MTWRRIAVAGVGARGEWWAKMLAQRLGERIEIVATADRNVGRNKRVRSLLKPLGHEPALFEDHRAMLAQAKPDLLLVVTPDHTHAAVVVDALKAGVDVLLEKPIATTAEDVRAILNAKRATGRRVVVGFNMRWAPPFTQVKDVLASGAIGTPVAVKMEWLLDTSHGADYFRRWHRERAKSGGLLVHKSTHHFDFVNWLLDSSPRQVFARGERRFYRPETAVALGLAERSERCLDCKAAAKCPYQVDMRQDQYLRDVYLANEGEDGYRRDRCIFSGDIDIPDSMSLSVRYASGALFTYSLQAFSPWEGVVVNVDGTKGRIQFLSDPSGQKLRLQTLGGKAEDVEPWKGEGMHLGGDELMTDALFGDGSPDRLGRTADERAGAWSAMLGIAANASMDAGREVRITDLVPELADESAAKAR